MDRTDRRSFLFLFFGKMDGDGDGDRRAVWARLQEAIASCEGVQAALGANMAQVVKASISNVMGPAG